MKQFLILCCLIVPLSMHAHILNKTHLVLENHKNEGTTLTVVFKTRQLVDILKAKYPELNNKGLNSVLFKQKATAYFNETISISSNELNYQLSSLNYEFDGLQSSVRFVIKDLENIEGLSIQISSFFEIDAHMLHDMTLIRDGKYESIEFTKEASTQLITFQRTKKPKSSWYKTFDFLVVVFIGIGLTLLLFFSKKLILFLQHWNKTEIA